MTRRQFNAAVEQYGEALWSARKYCGGGFNLSEGVGKYLERADAMMFTKAGKRRAAFLRDRRSKVDVAFHLYQQDT